MTTIPQLLKLLFSTLPPVSGDGDAALSAYAIALDGHDLRDIEEAIHKLIRGEFPGHNHSFAPSAPVLGAAVIKCRDRRVEHERLVTPPKRLPEPVISDEERARVSAGFRALSASMDDLKKPERVAEDREYWKRVNDYFVPDMTPDAMKRRLRIEVGDSDAEGDMGGVAA